MKPCHPAGPPVPERGADVESPHLGAQSVTTQQCVPIVQPLLPSLDVPSHSQGVLNACQRRPE